jgi:hypothetical protein
MRPQPQSVGPPRPLLIARQPDFSLSIPRSLEQNHDSRALKSIVQGVDFLRKSTLCFPGLGYTYRDSAVTRDPLPTEEVC